MKVYLASRYQDYPQMREWRSLLKTDGHIVTSRWINGDHEITGVNDDSERRRFALEDYGDLYQADLMIFNSPKEFFGTGRGGRHVELGLAIGWNKPIILVGERENVFHWMPLVTVVRDFDSARKAIISLASLSGKNGVEG